MLPKHCKLIGQIAARPCPLSASSRPAHALQTVRPGWQAKPPTPWRCRWLDAIEPAAACCAPVSQHGSCAVRSLASFRRRAFRHLDVSVRSAAAATHGGSDPCSSTGRAREGLGGFFDTVRREVSKLNGQWGKFIPMILVRLFELLILLLDQVRKTMIGSSCCVAHPCALSRDAMLARLVPAWRC